MPTTYERLIRLAEETFDMRDDPEQLSMTEDDFTQLGQIHPAALSEHRVDNAPVAWMLLFPTTGELMRRFLRGKIGERQLLHETPIGASYDAVYICSALVLEEYRRQGIARRLALDALQRMRADHPVDTLFIWVFTEGGDRLAASIADASGLPLLKRKDREQP